MTKSFFFILLFVCCFTTAQAQKFAIGLISSVEWNKYDVTRTPQEPLANSSIEDYVGGGMGVSSLFSFSKRWSINASAIYVARSLNYEKGFIYYNGNTNATISVNKIQDDLKYLVMPLYFNYDVLPTSNRFKPYLLGGITIDAIVGGREKWLDRNDKLLASLPFSFFEKIMIYPEVGFGIRRNIRNFDIGAQTNVAFDTFGSFARYRFLGVSRFGLSFYVLRRF